MKPQAFDYRAASTLDEAIALLVELGDESKVLAGGQSLLPMMNFRLARPTALVDIGRLSALKGLQERGSSVRVGALTTHRDLETCDLEGPTGKLLRLSASKVGHLPIRTRGTFGGSLAHSDPSSEWCMLATLLDAHMEIAGPRGTRVVPASDFLITLFTTALDYDEVLTGITLPMLTQDYHVNLVEFSRRAGDFAIVAVMAAYQVADGVIADARLCVGGVADRTLRLVEAERSLLGREPSPEAFGEAADVAMGEVSPSGDLHGPAEFRRDLVRTLTARTLAGATS